MTQLSGVSSSDGDGDDGLEESSHFLKGQTLLADEYEPSSSSQPPLLYPEVNPNEAIPLGPPSSVSSSVPGYGGNSSYVNDQLFGGASSSSWNSEHGLSSTTNGYVRPAGDTGITNLGNTCFMNSGLQSLIHTGRLAEYFLSTRFEEKEDFRLLREFQTVMKLAWFGSSSCICVSDFREKLGEIHPQFKDGRQHDCQEFLALMLDTLHEQLKKREKVGRLVVGKRRGRRTSSSGYHSSFFAYKSPRETKGKQKHSLQIEEPVTKRCKRESEEDDTAEVDSGIGDTGRSPSSEASPGETKDAASEYWDKHIQDNNTVVSNSFQGLFKSTVVCSHCSFVSVTYEPFTYLTVPIPRATTRKINVKFVSVPGDRRPHDTTVTVQVDDTVLQLKQAVALEVPGLDFQPQNFVVTEVVNNTISRKFEDETPLSAVNDEQRNVYMYELNQNFAEDSTTFPLFYAEKGSEMNPSTYLDEDWDSTDPIPPVPLIEMGEQAESTTEPVASEPSSDLRPEDLCIICLETLPVCHLRKHKGCPAVLCEDCVKKCAEYYVNERTKEGKEDDFHFACPTCKVHCRSEDFVPFWAPPTSQLILVTLMFKRPSDSNNNSLPPTGLFGAPLLVRMPNHMSAVEFHQFIRTVNPFPELETKVLTVNCDASRCANCLLSDNCDGCPVPTEGQISIPSNSTLVLSYANISLEQIADLGVEDMATVSPALIHLSPSPFRPEPHVDLHECLQSFSEVEHLDEQNPWNCPDCKGRHRATKTMAISRLPDYLIVYLKRFVYENRESRKLGNYLHFPLKDLDMTSYVDREGQQDQNLSFDLYSTVCHFGTASAGHYAAFAKNPVTEIWHYFNDTIVTPSTPTVNSYDFGSAYVLFYQRQGTNVNIPERSNANMTRLTPCPLGKFWDCGSEPSSTIPDSALEGTTEDQSLRFCGDEENQLPVNNGYMDLD